tara:strand:- start:907 stop:1803 length:897 start_codon:yes stop_codon:yes gene_type:complete
MNFYELIWKELEAKNPLPRRARNVVELDFDWFNEIIQNENKNEIKKIIENLFMGDIYLLKKAFTKEFLERIKKNCFEYFLNIPPSFHKMKEGCPDFHRKIDVETGKKYSFSRCSHSYYFYRWNNDPINLFNEIDKRWRLVKKLMGLNFDEFEKNTPKNGVVDRVQLVRYPSSIGYLEPHSDPYKHQKLFISGYMSKQNEDFDGLGFYLIDKFSNIVEVENNIDVGDLGLGFATVQHGVAPVNLTKKPNWEDMNDGRWFLSMYSNQSDEVKVRHTGQSIKNQISINNENNYVIKPLKQN